MPAPTPVSPLTQYNNFKIEQGLANVNYALNDLRSKYNSFVKLLGTTDDIASKRIKRIEDYLTADVQKFNQISVRSLAAITGTIGGWTIDAVSIRNTASTVKLRGAGNLAFGATPPTSATVGTGLFLDSTGLYGLNANTQEFYVKSTDGKGYFGTGAAILSTLGLTLTTPAYIAIGATPPTGAAAGTGTYIDATGFYNVSSNATTVAIQPTVVALTNTINDINISKSSGSWYGLNLTMVATAPVTLLEGVEISVSGGTPTDAKGVYISQIASGTNRKGIHIGTIAAGAANYALYSEALAQSVHAGNLRIGSTVAPTVALDVTGATLISTTLGVTGHVTLEGVTSTGATGTGKLVFDTAPTLSSLTLGTPLPLSSGGTAASLVDPNADRIFFWDDSAGATDWLAPGNSIAITTTTIDTIQDIRTTASPTFANLTDSALTSGRVVVAGASGILSDDADLTFATDTLTVTKVIISTNILPDANDGAVLGAAGTAWSDLFLAEGGVINWDSSDATITQTGNAVAVEGAALYAGAVPPDVTNLGFAVTAAGAVEMRMVSATSNGDFVGLVHGGTIASPTATANAQATAISLKGYNNAATPAITTAKAYIQLAATEAWTTTAQGTKIDFATTAATTTTRAVRLTIDSTQILMASPIVQTPAAAQDISGNGQTITLPTNGAKEITAGGARTGTIIASGTIDGQRLILFNSSAGSVTMAAAATSHVANGVICVLRPLEAAEFVWDSGASLWFALGDAQ